MAVFPSAAAQAEPFDPFKYRAKAMQIQGQVQGQQLQQQQMQENQLDIEAKKRAAQDDQIIQQTVQESPGATLHDLLPKLSGHVTAARWMQLNELDQKMQENYQKKTENDLKIAAEQHQQYQGIYSAVMQLPDEAVASNWPQIAQSIAAVPGNKIPVDPAKPMTKQQIQSMGPMLALNDAYLANETAKRKAKAEEQSAAAKLPGEVAESQLKQAQAAAGGTADVDKYISNWLKERNLPNTAANWAKAHKAYTDETKVQPGVLRTEALGSLREYPVINKQTGELEMRNANEINASKGNFAPAGEGAKAMGKTALIEDIRGNIQQVRASLKNEKMPEFTAGQRAEIAVALGGKDASTAISAAFRGAVLGNLTPEQQDYLINLAQLKENAMAMRSVLGAGQGSDDMRAAIAATIPGARTPSKAYGLQQLDKFEAVLNRLGKGVPGMPLKGNGAQSSAPAGKEIHYKIVNGQLVPQ